MKPMLVTIPHSGEQIPSEVTWLSHLNEVDLMCDVDRFVDRLYGSAIQELGLPHVICPWHRYVVDLNRLAEDVDRDSVMGHGNPSGSFTTGLHWVKTTTGVVLMKQPIAPDLHKLILERYFYPFHRQVETLYGSLRAAGQTEILHLDLHSMPSMGTDAHRDPGQRRAEIVVSDFNGKSAAPRYKDVVVEAYQDAGFQVAYNWPYFGGRLTQTYGVPERGQHAIQVELRRDLYMDEATKRLRADWPRISGRLGRALKAVWSRI